MMLPRHLLFSVYPNFASNITQKQSKLINFYFPWNHQKTCFFSCKAEQPLRGMELQEKEAQKDYSIQEICLEKAYS